MASIAKHVLPPSRVPYFVRRNARGALPVYSDLRNAGTRYQVHIRNVDGHVDALAQDLRQSLVGAEGAHRLSVKVLRQRHIVLAGGRFKRDVLAWLTARGF